MNSHKNARTSYAGRKLLIKLLIERIAVTENRDRPRFLV